MLNDTVPPIAAEVISEDETQHFNVRLHVAPRVGEEISVLSQFLRKEKKDCRFGFEVVRIRHSITTEEMPHEPEWEKPSHYLTITVKPINT